MSDGDRFPGSAVQAAGSWSSPNVSADVTGFEKGRHSMQSGQLSLLVILTVVLACGDPVSVPEDEFTIRATGQELILTNDAAAPTFYLIVERETAALFDFATCVDVPVCPPVGSKAIVRVPYRDVIGYRPGRTEAIVYWWRSAPSPDGPQVDSVRTTVMEL